jgi:hypothetical protein
MFDLGRVSKETMDNKIQDEFEDPVELGRLPV